MKIKIALFRTALIMCLFLSIYAISTVHSYGLSHAIIKTPRYIAHRGWSARAPENTLAAFKLAAKNKKFYGVEFDVWEASYSEDSEDPLLLVMHDPTTERMCGIKADIRTLNRVSLNEYTIIKGKNIKKYRGQKIPTVEQSLNVIFKSSKKSVPVIELKNRLSPRALEHLLKSLKGRKAVIISFDLDALDDVIKMSRSMGISKKIDTMYLVNSLSKNDYAATIKRMRAAGVKCISLKYTAINKQTVKTFHKSKMKVGAWTIPTKKKARIYKKMGVDYLTCDDALY